MICMLYKINVVYQKVKEFHMSNCKKKKKIPMSDIVNTIFKNIKICGKLYIKLIPCQYETKRVHIIFSIVH